MKQIKLEKNKYLKKQNKHIIKLYNGTKISKKSKKISYKQNTSEKNNYKCPECRYKGRDNYNIKVHLKQHNNKLESKIKCISCSFYCTINNMANHEKVHSEYY